MAGNTSIRGLAADNKVQLERWGVRKLVQLDEAGMANLRAVLYGELPKRPSFTEKFTTVSYDYETGRIMFSLSPAEALVLAATFNEHPTTWPSDWVNGLQAAVLDHKNHTSSTGEPGIDPAVDAEYANKTS